MVNMVRGIVQQSLYIKVSDKMNSTKIKHLIQFIIFLIIAALLFTMNTHLFRNNNWEQQHINGIKNEHDLDMVCVGGSSTFVYWEPFLAWNEFGMTSYDYATDSNRPAIMKEYIKSAIEKAHPKFLLIDLRCYTGDAISAEDLTSAEGGLRNMTDSLDLNLTRLQTVNDIMRFYDGFHDDDEDPWSYYFDIGKYHVNYAQLGVPDNWKHVFNGQYKSPYKGFEFITTISYQDFLSKPQDYKTSAIGKLDPMSEKYLYELLDYVKKTGVQALFVAPVLPVDKYAELQYNRINQIVSSYGFKFLNTNDYYDEMGIDFSKDFYNSGHVNVYGAEKYTRFVADYIRKNYQIDDHRNDSNYDSWNKFYEDAHQQDLLLKKTIDDVIKQKNITHSNGEKMQSETDYLRWRELAEDTGFSIVCVSKGKVPEIDARYPWNISKGQDNIIRVYSAGSSVYESNGTADADYSGTIGTHSIPIIANSGDKAKIIISDTEIPITDSGVYIAVFDNGYNELMDAIKIGEDRSMRHIK